MIGAGPSGLAAAAMLGRAPASGHWCWSVVEIGAVWESRYDRLHLHTVRWLSGLPGYPHPAGVRQVAVT